MPIEIQFSVLHVDLEKPDSLRESITPTIFIKLEPVMLNSNNNYWALTTGSLHKTCAWLEFPLTLSTEE